MILVIMAARSVTERQLELLTALATQQLPPRSLYGGFRDCRAPVVRFLCNSRAFQVVP